MHFIYLSKTNNSQSNNRVGDMSKAMAQVINCFFTTDSLQELFRKVRSILNKLTPQKFNQLMKQVTDLTIDTEERLKGVIDLVFEKAIDEPSFSVAYGNMCRCLATVSRSPHPSEWTKSVGCRIDKKHVCVWKV